LLTKRVLLLQNSMCWHYATATIEAIRQLNPELSHSPIYSGTRPNKLSDVWTINRSLAWMKICK
jgi:hypothetical protein